MGMAGGHHRAAADADVRRATAAVAAAALARAAVGRPRRCRPCGDRCGRCNRADATAARVWRAWRGRRARACVGAAGELYRTGVLYDSTDSYVAAAACWLLGTVVCGQPAVRAAGGGAGALVARCQLRGAAAGNRGVTGAAPDATARKRRT